MVRSASLPSGSLMMISTSALLLVSNWITWESGALANSRLTVGAGADSAARAAPAPPATTSATDNAPIVRTRLLMAGTPLSASEDDIGKSAGPDATGARFDGGPYRGLGDRAAGVA